MADVDSDFVQAVGRLEGKMDAMLVSQDLQRSEANHRESRISALERWRAFLVGSWAVLTVAVSLAFKIVYDMLSPR